MDGGRITIISLNIDDELLENLKIRAIEMESDYSDLIGEYIQRGLNGCDNMSMVSINENVMEKIHIKCGLSKKSPEEVVNELLWDNLRKLEDPSNHLDGETIWNMLEHDKPEGDDILDRITDMF